MKKQIFFVIAAAAVGVGCFGSDPNKNSQLANGDGAATTGGGGAGGASNPNGPIVGNPIATFDTGLNGFAVNAYHDPGQINLGDPNSGVAGGMPTMTFDGTVGSPSSGSLQVVVPYSGANQYVDIQNTGMFSTVPANWTGGTLHVRVRADSGSFVGVVEPYAITIPKSFVFGGTSTNFAKNNNDWQEFTVNLTTPVKADSGYDPTQVIIFGLQINSGSSGASQAPITFHVDSFSVSGIAAPPGAGGGGAGGGGAAGGAGGGGAGGGGAGGAAGRGAAGSSGAGGAHDAAAGG